MRANTTRAGADVQGAATATTAVFGFAFCLALFTVPCALLVPRRAEAQDAAVESSTSDDSLAFRLGLRLHAVPLKDRSDAESIEQLWIEAVSGRAARAGVQAGDVLIAVNGVPVRTLAQVVALVAKSKKSLALLIVRDERQIFIAIRL